MVNVFVGGLLFDWRRDVVAARQNFVAVVNISESDQTLTIAVEHEKADAEHLDLIRAHLAASEEARKWHAYGVPLVVDFKRKIVDSKIVVTIFHQIEVRSINAIPSGGLYIEDNAIKVRWWRFWRPDVNDGAGQKLSGSRDAYFQNIAVL